MAELEKQVDELFSEWDRTDSPGAAVAIVQGAEVLAMRGYGMANLEYDVPITPATIFDIASVSKQFGGMAIAMLLNEGKLSLDDDIRKYLPDVPDFGDTITIRHLVHHTSGLRDWVQSLVIAGGQMDDVITFGHILRFVRRQRALNFTPGAEYLYSNTGYNLLAEIVERVTDQSFREWTDAQIFTPLGMADTHFHDDYQEVIKNRAYSYWRSEEGVFKHAVNNLTALASSSLYTTVEDLVKWMHNFDRGHVGGAAVIEQMQEPGVLNSGEQIAYAFGQSVATYRGLKTIDHNGSWRGFRSTLLRFPDQTFAVVILSNLMHMNPERLARQIADIYLAGQMNPKTPTAKPTEPPQKTTEAPVPPTQSSLEEFIGGYYTEELDTTYTIVVKDSGLVIQHRRHADIPLTYAGGHFTGTEWFFPQIHFVRNTENQVTGFRLTGGRVRNLRFDRVISENEKLKK